MRNKMRSSGEKLTVNNYYKDRTKHVPSGFGGKFISLKLNPKPT